VNEKSMSAPSEIDGNASIVAFLSYLQNYGGFGRSPMNGFVELINGHLCRWKQAGSDHGRTVGTLCIVHSTKFGRVNPLSVLIMDNTHHAATPKVVKIERTYSRGMPNIL
jgi:hypothetical protein